MNLISKDRLLLILLALFLAFFIGGKFTHVVLAGCASGYYCAGTTVMDLPSCCKGPLYSIGGDVYYTQDYAYWTHVDCDADCSFTIDGAGCCNETNGSCYLCTVRTNCCAKITGPYCGDGSCNGDETCSTCSDDCGACCTPSCPLNCGEADGCGIAARIMLTARASGLECAGKKIHPCPLPAGHVQW